MNKTIIWIIITAIFVILTIIVLNRKNKASQKEEKKSTIADYTGKPNSAGCISDADRGRGATGQLCSTVTAGKGKGDNRPGATVSSGRG